MSAADTRTAILRPDFKWAVSRFPLTLLAAALLTLWMLVFEFKRALARAAYEMLSQDQIMFMLILAFLVATASAFTTLRLRPWVGLTAQAVGFFLGLEVGYITETTPYTVMPLFLSLICFISLGAGYAARLGMIGAWLTALSLAANFALCLVALGIILGGGAVILESIETLLGFDTNQAWKLLLIVASWLGVPLFWLSLSRFCEDEPTDEQPVNLLHRVISVVTDGLLIPLMLIFAGVIHLYAGRIVLMLGLPNGQIGWIVPTYLCIGYGIYLLAHTPGALLPRLRCVFVRIWLLATLIPLVLLGIAAGMRIDAYGITEERYLLALIVLGFALVALSALMRRPFDLRILPLLAGTLTLVAAIGPLSARNVTIHSQAARLRAIASSVTPEQWAQSRDGGLSERQKKDFLSALHELEQHEVGIDQIISSDAWPQHLPRSSSELKDILRTNVVAETSKYTYVSFDDAEVIRLDSVTLIEGSRIDFELTTPQTRSSGALKYTLQVMGNILEVSGEGNTTRFDLSTLLTQEDKPVGNGPRPVFQSVEGRKGELIVEQFTRRQDPTGAKLRNVKAQVVLY
ncbi:DUF4153 domain-containing protein [Microvirga sp. P5_D2]